MTASLDPTLWEAIKKNTPWIRLRCSQAEFDKDKLDELVQDVMVRLIQSNTNFMATDIKSPDAWVKRITTNTAKSYQRDQSKKIKATNAGADPNYFSGPDNSEHSFNMGQVLEYVRENFSDIDQEIMQLVLMREEHKSIAEIVGLSPSNVANKASELKAKIKNHFEKRGY